MLIDCDLANCYNIIVLQAKLLHIFAILLIINNFFARELKLDILWGDPQQLSNLALEVPDWARSEELEDEDTLTDLVTPDRRLDMAYDDTIQEFSLEDRAVWSDLKHAGYLALPNHLSDEHSYATDD